MSPALIENIATWKLTKFIHMNIFSMLVFVSLLLPLLRFLARYLSRRCLNPKTASVRSANLAGMNLQLRVSCLSKVSLFGSESTIRSECYATPAARARFIEPANEFRAPIFYYSPHNHASSFVRGVDLLARAVTEMGPQFRREGRNPAMECWIE